MVNTIALHFFSINIFSLVLHTQREDDSPYLIRIVMAAVLSYETVSLLHYFELRYIFFKLKNHIKRNFPGGRLILELIPDQSS